MDLFPLWNSIRIALISSIIVFFLGILAAYYIAKLPRIIKGILDVILTMPLVLPPTVVGYMMLRLVGTRYPFGQFLKNVFDLTIPMKWWSAILVTVIVIFPLMYRTTRAAFES
ncbi:MAG: molybdate ABC transporter permease subunit, partial [Lachnospiraceae bacterium]|nr:molybdate ABC transporter permease subunit [Lachnospiraceae bacterium]